MEKSRFGEMYCKNNNGNNDDEGNDNGDDNRVLQHNSHVTHWQYLKETIIPANDLPLVVWSTVTSQLIKKQQPQSQINREEKKERM